MISNTTDLDRLDIDPGTPGLLPPSRTTTRCWPACAPTRRCSSTSPGSRPSPATTTSARSVATPPRSAPAAARSSTTRCGRAARSPGRSCTWTRPSTAAGGARSTASSPRARSSAWSRAFATWRGELLDAVPPGEVVDLVDVLAAPLPGPGHLRAARRAGRRTETTSAGGPTRRSSPRTVRRRSPPDALRDVMELVAFLEQLATRQAGQPGRRRGVAARRGGGRRPAPHCGRARHLQHVAAGRRQRDHASPHLGRDDGARRAPGPARRYSPQSRRRSRSRSRSASAGSRRSSSSPVPRPGTPRSATSRSTKATTW